MKQDVKQMKSLALAYAGDAVYELHVREHLLETGQVKPNQLHQKAITFVSGKAQAAVILHWLHTDCLSEEERRIVARGRNAKSGSRSEEHTSELQSRFDLVCRLLLENK